MPRSPLPRPGDCRGSAEPSVSVAERVLAVGTVHCGRGISGCLTGGATAASSSAAAAAAWPGAPSTGRRRCRHSPGRRLLARRALGSGTHLGAPRWTVPRLDASQSLIHTAVSSTIAVEAVSFFEMETGLGSALARFRVCAGVRERVPCARAAQSTTCIQLPTSPARTEPRGLTRDKRGNPGGSGNKP